MRIIITLPDAGWSSMVARRAHNPKVVGSNPAPATKFLNALFKTRRFVLSTYLMQFTLFSYPSTECF